MRRFVLKSTTTLLLVVPLLVSCGDPETVTQTTPTVGVGPDQATESPDRVRTPRRPTTPNVTLPDAPPLADEAAGAVLQSLAGDLAGDDVSRAVLLYMHELGLDEGLTAAREQLLAMEDGEYDDDESAALGLEIELLHGSSGAAAKILALGDLVVEDEFAGPFMAHALAAIDAGAERDRAEALLARIAGGDDDEAAHVAVEALALRRSSAAESVLPGLIADVDRYEWLRGTALAGMAAIGHPRTQTSADALFADEDIDLSEVLYGLAVPGITEAVTFVERGMAIGLEEGAADFEFAAASEALATIHSPDGDEQARGLIASWLATDDTMAGDESVVALWRLGDEAQAPYVARILVGEVARASYIDTQFAVDILEELARRGLARDPRFRKAVDAAAVAQADPERPGTNLNVEAIRAAAAYAYLKSR